MSLEKARIRFDDFVRVCGEQRSSASVTGLGDELIAAYSSNRAYHTLEHIDECLAHLAWWQVSTGRTAPCELSLALWYHDFVYIPGAQDNEARSAEAGVRAAQVLGWNEGSQQYTGELILATAHLAEDVPERTVASVVSESHALIRDIDLTVLGAPPSRYARYRKQVRAEYAHLSEARYNSGRAIILEQFLGRTCIYELPLFFDAFEAQARQNLESELDELRVRTGA